MKKALLVLLSSAILVMPACQPTRNSNTGVTNTANSNAALSEDEFVFIASDESPERCRSKAADEVMVEILVSNSDVGGCSFADPGEVEVSKKQKVRWCIINNCNVGPIQLLIDTFVNVASASEKNPFGNRQDRDNIFFTNPIRYTKAKSIVSKVPHPDSAPQGGKKGYKYYIKLFGPSGELLHSVDPHVVISDS